MLFLWIFLGIIGFILSVAAAVLLLPVKIFITKHENEDFNILFKILGIKLDLEQDDKKDKGKIRITEALKKATGVDRIDKNKLKHSVKNRGFFETVSQYSQIIIELIKEVGKLLHHCKVKKLYVKVVCAENDAADTAITYGRCCAVVYPLAGLAGSVMKVKKKGCQIGVFCDYTSGQGSFSLETIISVRLVHVLVALLKIIINETRRQVESETGKESTLPVNIKKN